VQNPSPGTPRPLYSEAEQGYFAAVSPESTVEPNTSIVDSVIMEGAVVRAGAIVARSLVCPGATVEANEVVVDQVRAGSRIGVPSGVGRGERSG
jgi:NDP-sugar pyrophosphorylase family protein